MEANPTRLFAVLDDLVDRWCERRALRPLAVLLPAYPPAPLHADQWGALFAAIRSLKGLAPEVLTAEEGAAVAEAHALARQVLKRTAAGRQIVDAAG